MKPFWGWSEVGLKYGPDNSSNASDAEQAPCSELCTLPPGLQPSEKRASARVAVVSSLSSRSFLFASLEVTGKDGGEHGQEEGAPRLPLLSD